jgi:rubrerythrin
LWEKEDLKGRTMPRWTADDIAWDSFDGAKLDQGLLKLIKAASLTEYNAAQYTRYLHNIFRDDAEFAGTMSEWQLEEEQHGRMLARYAQLADPGFDFAAAFKKFTDGYKIPTDVQESVRGSRVGELVARCIVETGTSSFYTALSEATDEPVLKQLAHRIASDEFRHYRTFYDGLERYQRREPVSVLHRLKVVIGRVRETDDDELAYAYHCANEPDADYDRERCGREYSKLAYAHYRPHHAEQVVNMAFRAGGLKPRGWLSTQVTKWAWRKMRNLAGRPVAA